MKPRAFVVHRDPWHKGEHSIKIADRELQFAIPHDVFSTLRIDEGTILLLKHLPEAPPAKVLDLGCGYGALGLPVAALHPKSRVKLVDRDLLAVEWARRNAVKNDLRGVEVVGSLGFDQIEDRDYDWILCNVPARIGKPFMVHLFKEGSRRLNRGGELRVVVIRDLVPVIREISRETGMELKECAVGPRHSVFSLSAPEEVNHALDEEVSGLYLRDMVQVSGIEFERPFDLGGDDPKRLKSSLPLLLDALPRQEIPDRILCIRSGYGILPVLFKIKWPDSSILAFDRDLLGLKYGARNSERILGEGMVKFAGGWFFPETIPVTAEFDLIVIEISSSSGMAVAAEELIAALARTSKGGRVLGVCLDKVWREWIQPLIRREGLPARALASREGFTVFSAENRD